MYSVLVPSPLGAGAEPVRGPYDPVLLTRGAAE